ncbi:MAG: tRNA adenosine(34) deaminase TadA [Halanaerobiaceae bacterium]
MKTDEEYMKIAILEAEKALEIEEVPIGAIVVYGDKVIGRGYNLKERNYDPTAHAEIIALQDAARNMHSWRLDDCSLYVTIEPCPMCAGAIVQARIKKLVFGAYDLKAGATGSLYNITDDSRLNHQVTQISGGILEEECRSLMKNFFAKLRRK